MSSRPAAEPPKRLHGSRTTSGRKLMALFVLVSSVPFSIAFRPATTAKWASWGGRCRTLHVTPGPAGPSSGVQESATTDPPSSSAVPPPLYRSEGICSVAKPPEWTSNDAVSFLRKMLERDARERGARPSKVGSRGANKSQILRVGHGGTLDPLATGVLVIGVGRGTKELQSYLSGTKAYTAEAEFGFETTTLDMDPTGNITKRASFDHISRPDLETALASFVGTIQQVPPIYSAIRKGGKRLYEQARNGATEEDLQVESREVVIHKLDLLEMAGSKFSLSVECGGGTYVRSLIRDIAHKLGTVATMTALNRTKQGQFTLEHSITKEEWSPDNIYAAIDRCNAERER